MVETLIVGPLSRSVSGLRHYIPETGQVFIVLGGIDIQIMVEAVGHPQGTELVPGKLLDEVALNDEVQHELELSVSFHASFLPSSDRDTQDP